MVRAWAIDLIGTLHKVDQDATLWINSLSSPWSDSFWTMMSDIKFWIPTYILCAFFLFKRLGWKKALIVLASAALAFGLCDQISNLVKHSVSRLRPCYSFPMLDGGLNVLEKRGGFYGFFSAHAANAFAFATCLSLGFLNDKTHNYKAFIIGYDLGFSGRDQPDFRRETLSRRCPGRDSDRNNNRLPVRQPIQFPDTEIY